MFFLSLCCIFNFLFPHSAVPRSFSAYLLSPSAVSFCLFQICFHSWAFAWGSQRFLQKLNGPNKRKNLALSNKPVVLLKSKKSRQSAFPCIVLLLLVTVGLYWNYSFHVSWTLRILWQVGDNSCTLVVTLCVMHFLCVKKWCNLLRLGRALRDIETASLLRYHLACSHSWEL